MVLTHLQSVQKQTEYKALWKYKTFVVLFYMTLIDFAFVKILPRFYKACVQRVQNFFSIKKVLLSVKNKHNI